MTDLATDWLGNAEPPRNVGGRPAKDRSGRQRKMLCPDCGFIAYASAGAMERAGGLPSCACGAAMILPNLRDRAAVEWDALDAELKSYGVTAYNDAMRELGYGDAVVRTHKERRGGAERRRCTWDAGHCTRWPLSGSDRCREHAR